KLPPPYWGKPRVHAILLSLLEEVNELDCAVQSTIIGRYRDLAFGRQLDRLGKLLGLPNQGWGPLLYQKYLDLQILGNASKGRINDILRGLRILWGNSTRRMYNLGYASFAAEVVGVG